MINLMPTYRELPHRIRMEVKNQVKKFLKDNLESSQAIEECNVIVEKGSRRVPTLGIPDFLEEKFRHEAVLHLRKSFGYQKVPFQAWELTVPDWYFIEGVDESGLDEMFKLVEIVASSYKRFCQIQSWYNLKMSRDDSGVSAMNRELPPLPEKVTSDVRNMEPASSFSRETGVFEDHSGHEDLPKPQIQETELADLEIAYSPILNSESDKNEGMDTEDSAPQKRSSFAEDERVARKSRKLTTESSPSRSLKKTPLSTTPQRASIKKFSLSPKGEKATSVPSSPVTEVSTISYEEQTELRDLTRYTKYFLILKNSIMKEDDRY
jgi:hypothetical protein